MKESDSLYSQIRNVMFFLEDADGGLWLSTYGDGLYHYDRSKEVFRKKLPVQEHPDSLANFVLGMFLDQGGLYWLFTQGGLFHYDRKADTIGYTGIPFSVLWNNANNTEDFNLAEPGDGSVWMAGNTSGFYTGESAGLYKYDPSTREFQNFRHNPGDPSSLNSNKVSHVISDEQGNLWIATFGGGLNLLRGPGYDVFEHFRHDPADPNSIFSDTLTTIIKDASGILWIGGIAGFSRLDPGNMNFDSYRIRPSEFSYSSGISRSSISRIRLDREGHGWFMLFGSQGLLHFNPASGDLYQYIDVQSDNTGLAGTSRLFELVADRSGFVWAMTEGALNQVEKQPAKPFHLYRSIPTIPGTLSHSDVKSLMFDAEGTLWVGTIGPVLNRCSGLIENLPGPFIHYPLYNELRSPDMVMSMLENDRKSLWIGTYHGLYHFDKNSGEYKSFSAVSKIQSVLDEALVDGIFQDSKGWTWFATRRDGMFIYNPEANAVRNYGSPSNFTDSLPRYTNMSFSEDVKGDLWFGNFSFGITRLPASERSKIFSPEKPFFERFRNDPGNPSSLSSDQVVDVVHDSKNRLWIGTTDGLNLYDPDRHAFHTFRETDGLPDDCIFGILEDDHGNLWVSTLNGICKIETAEGTGRETIQSIRSYGAYEGIAKPVFNEHSRCKSPDGWMYFGGIYGLTVFHPDSIRENTIPPPVYITDIRINDLDIRQYGKPLIDRSIHETKNIRLPFRENFLSLEFVALNYISPEKCRYRYRMEGLDNDWVEAGERRFAEYRDLKPGSYTFRVMACNEDGYWNEEGASIGITINSPWYRTIPAYLGYLVLILLAGYGFMRWRTWQLRKEKEELDALVKERTSVIENQNREILNVNTQLEEQKEELEQQTEELKQQKEELQSTLNRLEETQEQLIQSEKLAALGGLVAGVAHEINTPVGISVTAASNLAEETKVMAEKYKTNKISKADFKEYLSTANQSARLILANMERTAQMVQSFKLVSADQSTGEKRRVVLRTYVEDIIRSLYPRLKGRKIAIVMDIDPNLEVESYPGAISQIFTNLILNSLVHGYAENEKGDVTIEAALRDGKLELNYSDSGKGVEPSNLNKIFDPFFTTNKKVGTGLGLHIVYNLVTQKLNGTIGFESKPGEGVRFNILIPV
jgi:signal transduction histidine kinase/ligand-binding sensor domain-containing protein